MTKMRHVNAYLVSSSRLQLQENDRRAIQAFQNLEVGSRLLRSGHDGSQVGVGPRFTDRSIDRPAS